MKTISAGLRTLRCVLGISVALVACGKEQGASHERSTERQTQRIVSLAPSTTEALFALGLGPRVVGVSRFCNYPPAAKSLPKVGGFIDPSLEAILALRPTLVVGARSPNNRGVVRILEQQGVSTYFPTIHSVSDIIGLLGGLAKRTGQEKIAQARISEIKQKLASVKAHFPKHKARVLLLFSEQPFSVTGPTSFADDVLTHAGAINVMGSGPAYPTLSLEHIVSLSPDVIVRAIMEAKSNDAESGVQWSRFTSMPAVKNGKVITIQDDRLLRPGPRIADAVELLFQSIYGDAP
ncbi:MAG: ABC transporter substrate-binding protein [Myxococcales bacterium]|nr:MAG: ABC transporter substrate-binding protein [Myxococcales bacterium]